MNRTMVALFDNYADATSARQDLINSGFSAGEINLTNKPGEHVEESFWDKIRDFFEGNERNIYEEAQRRGGTLLSLSSDESRLDRAVDILQRHAPVDIDRRAEQWRQAGWKETPQTRADITGGTTEASKAGKIDSSRVMPTGEPSRSERIGATGKPTPTEGVRATEKGRTGEESIPVVEEQLRVGKRVETRGGVRIFSRVSERPVEEQVNLREERVNVERRPADRAARPGELREESFEMRETREEPVVRKEARVVEEVILHKDVEERTETVRDKVRRTDVEIQQLDENWRNDFKSRFANRGYTYEQTRAAYHYGEQLARDPYYGRMDWVQVEPEARRRFEERNPGMWDEFKDAVHNAFEQIHHRKAA